MIETVIRANQRGLALWEAFARRELLYFFVWRDIKIRYKQTTLGVLWAMLVPASQVLIFTVIFGRLAGIKPDGPYPYPLFVLAGLVPWTFFSQAVTMGGQSLVSQQHLLTKVYFPRLFVPAGTVGGCFVDFLISAGLFAGTMMWYRFVPSWQIVYVPLLIFLTVVASLGPAFLLSALTVRYRDFRFVVPVMMQLLMYISPVVYPISIIPPRYQWLLGINPISGIIDGFRSAILLKPWNYPLLVTSVASTFVLLAIGALYFRKTERQFADIA